MLFVFHLIYTVVWTFLLPALYLASVSLIKKWQPSLKMRLGQVPTEVYMHKNPIWFHAVSVGEFNALLPLLKLFFGTQIILSTTTETAYQLAKQKLKDEIENNLIKVFVIPWDHPVIVDSIMARIKPLALILMESEIWPGLIISAKKHQAKVIILNAKLSENSYKLYYYLGFIFEPLFKLIDLVLAQSSTHSRRYLNLKVAPEKLFMMGNMKFSALPNLNNQKQSELRESLGYANEDIVWVCGSTHEEEEAILIAIFQELKPRFNKLRLILAPRHPERFIVVESLVNGAARLNPIKLSSIKRGGDSGQIHKQDSVLIVDTIGDLLDIYSISNLAFVGGTINPKVGGHNVFEPALCNIPVLCGPHYSKNTDMYHALEDADGVLICETKEDIRINIQSLLENDDKRILIGANAKNFVSKNRKIILEIATKLKSFLFKP